jgi:nucleotide-binding universal stress UspA family protein
VNDALAIVATVALDERDDVVLGALRSLAARVPVRRVVVLHVAEHGVEIGVGLAERVAQLRAALPAVAVTSASATGRLDTAAARVLAETHADLLVIGRAGREGGRAAWGDRGLALLRAVDRPVLVVPAGAPVAFHTALVGMDLSGAALDAYALAARLCPRVSAVAVTSVDDPVPDELCAGLESRFHAAAAARGLAPVPLRLAAGVSPADALLAVASTADLVAVGSRGLSALAAVLLGSTAERLAGRSDRMVLVVRPGGEPRGVLGALLGS